MNEAAFSFTTKVGGDLLTVRGDSLEQFKQNLADLLGSEEVQNNLEQLNKAQF